MTNILILFLMLIIFYYQMLCHWILTLPPCIFSEPIQKIKINGIVEYCDFELGGFIASGWEGTVYDKETQNQK